MDSSINLNVYDTPNISERRLKENSIALKCFISILSMTFLIATPVAIAVTDISTEDFWSNLLSIITGPSKLVTDYFALGCLASSLFNAAICGIACNLILIFSRAKANATTFAAYMLVFNMIRTVHTTVYAVV